MTTPFSPDVHRVRTPARSRRRLAGLVAILLVVAVAGWWLLAGVSGGDDPAAHAHGFDHSEPVPVRVAMVELRSLPVYLTALGTVTPLNTVVIRSRVDGELIEVTAEEGDHVETGALLARIDPRPYEVALAEALGQQQQNLALLKNARGNLALYQGLWEQDSIARQELDNQEALVRQYEGLVKMDEARVDEAQLQLSFTRIVAPITGRLGLRRVDAGNLVNTADSEGLMTITQVDPISVLFHLPEGELPAVLDQTRSGAVLPVEAWDRTGSRLLAEGELYTIDNQIDTTTGTIALKARFANENLPLFPNQFVNVRMRLKTLQQTPVIPTAAIQHGAPGTFVYRVTADDTIQVRPITTGPASGRHTAIVAGLEPGERVVLEGMDRLREGTTVAVAASGIKADEGPVADGTQQVSRQQMAPAADDA